MGGGGSRETSVLFSTIKINFAKENNSTQIIKPKYNKINSVLYTNNCKPKFAHPCTYLIYLFGLDILEPQRYRPLSDEVKKLKPQRPRAQKMTDIQQQNKGWNTSLLTPCGRISATIDKSRQPSPQKKINASFQ